MNSSILTKRSGIKLAASFAACALLFSACSKKDDNNTSTEKSSNEASSNGNTESTSAGPKTVVPAEGASIDKSAQSSGFVFTVDKLTAAPSEYDPTTQTLTFETGVENLGPDASTPYVQIALEIGPTGDKESVNTQTDFPNVPGASKGKGTLKVDLDAAQLAKFSLDSAMLVFGNGDEAQAKIPLAGSEAGVTLMPVEQPNLGTVTAGDWSITPTKGVIRWDDTSSHIQVAKGSAWYQIDFDVQAGSSFNCINDGNLIITSPDGTAVGATSLTAPKNGSTCLDTSESVKGFSAIFELSSPVKGDYKVAMKGPFTPDGTDVTGDPVTVTLSETK